MIVRFSARFRYGALGDFLESCRYRSDDPSFVQGLTKVRSRDFQGAIHDFTEAITRNPNYADAYFGRGLARLELGDGERAKEDFQKAFSLFGARLLA